MKKILYLIGAGLLCAMMALVAMPTQNTYAAACEERILGLRPWYYGLTKDNDNECVIDENKFKADTNNNQLAESIWKIVFNLVGDIFAIVGYLAICFVIYGGYLYMFSSGDPGKAAKGKKTITNSIVGLAICMLASTIVGMVSDIAAKGASGNIFIVAINRAFSWAGVIAVIMVVVGGIQYTTSNGNPQQAAKAKQTITYAIVGLAISLLAIAIVNLAVGAINGGSN